jgi:hypothetical protein
LTLLEVILQYGSDVKIKGALGTADNSPCLTYFPDKLARLSKKTLTGAGDCRINTATAEELYHRQIQTHQNKIKLYHRGIKLFSHLINLCCQFDLRCCRVELHRSRIDLRWC